MRLLLLAAVLWAGCDGKGGGAGPSQDTAPVLTVTAMQLFRDYRDGNPAAADAKYQGKTIKVTGRVLAIERDGGGYVVGMETGPNVVASGVELGAAVVAPFPASARDTVSKLKPFDSVVIVGRCEGANAAEGRMGGIRITLSRPRIE